MTRKRSRARNLAGYLLRIAAPVLIGVIVVGGAQAQEAATSGDAGLPRPELPLAVAPAVAADADLTELVATLRAKLDQLKAQQRGSRIPVGQLAKELEQARLDVERMAELLVRQEITEVRQKAAVAVADQRVERLTADIAGVQGDLDHALAERDRMGELVAESTTRVEELATQLVALDEERKGLVQALDGSREEATKAREQLARADAEIDAIGREMKDLEARNSEAQAAYEKRVAEAQTRMAALEDSLAEERRTAERELASRDASIRTLEQTQEHVRSVLVGALAEIDAVASGEKVSAYEQEMLRVAEASNEARRSTLDALGFKRDAQGALVPPDVELSVQLAGRAGDNPASIEPGAGPATAGAQACPDMIETRDRAYLDDKASSEWQHFLVATLGFGEAKTAIDTVQIVGIATCLEALSAQPDVYFKVIGFTDARGSKSFNEELSLARARTVSDLIMQKIAIQPWRLFVQGRGEAFPLADNARDDGRAQNRRVEVFAVKARS